MNKFKINLRKETFFINGSGSVVGDICFSVGDWYFPSKRWDDFVATILYWLSQKVIKLRFNRDQIFEVPFMEGDFKIYVSLDKKNQSTIKFIKGDSFSDQKEIEQKIINLPFEELKNEVKKSCELLLKMKESENFDFEEEYSDLKESYELLCKC